MDEKQKQLMMQSLEDERNASFLYNGLAAIEKDARIAEVFRRMGEVEKRHALAWEERLAAQGVQAAPFKPAGRSRLLLWLAQRFGIQAVLATIMAAERDGVTSYTTMPEVELEMAVDESSHARMLQAVSKTVHGRGMEGGTLAQLEGRHKSAGGNALRAAVLGANDGLVSNLSLVMGVAGAAMDGQAILVTGLAGLLAGACSMALGEWLSVQSSRELYQHQIEIEKVEIDTAPEEEAEELALIYQARGIPEAQAVQMANRILEDPASALETLAREELSVDPAELGGSAWEAAITSFLLFAGGAIIPVAPFFFATGITAVVLSLAFSTLGLFVIGAGITLFTGRSVWFSGARQVIFGLGAAAVTYTIGRLIGINLGG